MRLYLYVASMKTRAASVSVGPWRRPASGNREDPEVEGWGGLGGEGVSDE